MHKALALLSSFALALALFGCGFQPAPSEESKRTDADKISEYHDSNRITYEHGDNGFTTPEGRDDIPKAPNDADASTTDKNATEAPKTAQNSTVVNTLKLLSNGVESGTFSGNGDDTFTMPSPSNIHLFRFTHEVDQGEMFRLEGFDANGTSTGYLGEASSAPSGTFTDMLLTRLPTDVQVHSSSPWTVEVVPLDQMQRAENGGTYVGPQVLYVDESAMSKITFKYEGGYWFEAYGVNASTGYTTKLVAKSGPLDSTHVYHDAQALLVVEVWTDVPWTLSWE